MMLAKIDKMEREDDFLRQKIFENDIEKKELEEELKKKVYAYEHTIKEIMERDFKSKEKLKQYKKEEKEVLRKVQIDAKNMQDKIR